MTLLLRGPLTIEHSKISENIGSAGGLSLFGVGDVTISRSDIAHNGPNATVRCAVGGIRIDGIVGDIRIEDSTIRDNSGEIGGGVLGSANGITDVIRSQICNNTTIDFAAGIKVDSPLNVIDSVVSGNVGGYVGGIVTAVCISFARP